MSTTTQTTKPRRRIGRPSPAMVVSLIALFVALTGTAYAIEAGSITSRHVKDDSLRSEDIKDDTLSSADLKDGEAVAGTDVIDDSLGTADLQPHSVGYPELKASSVASSNVIENSLGGNDIGASAVGSSELDPVHTRLGEIVEIESSGTPSNGDGAGAIATASCEPDEELLSGGARFGGERPGDDLSVTELDVDSSADKVTAIGNNDQYSSIQFRAIALCLAV